MEVVALNFLDHLSAWIDEQRPYWETLGRVRYSRTNDDRDKHSISLVIESGPHFIDLMVWDSGEVEFGHGTMEDQRDEHHDLGTVADLHQLTDRIQREAEAWTV